MKKLCILIFTLTLTLMLVGCGGEDNSYDGINGLKTPEELFVNDVDVLVQDIEREILQKDSEDVLAQAEILLESIKNLDTLTNKQNLQNSRDEFKALVFAYKRVETLYVAGYESNDMRDIADFYIEQYIKASKSQDTVGDLDAVFAGNKTIVANSLKGITALEYTLFGNAEPLDEVYEKMNQNRLDSALLMANNLVVQFKEVQNYYAKQSSFGANSEESIEALLNVLVSSSYSLRETRIGDAAGYTAKYKNNPDNTRLEYFKSTNSLEAIKVILQTHQNLMDNGLKDIAISGNIKSEADAVSTAIQDALDICDSYNTNIESELVSSKTLSLYESIRTMQNNYTAMINGLNFTQKLLEADGD